MTKKKMSETLKELIENYQQLEVPDINYEIKLILERISDLIDLKAIQHHKIFTISENSFVEKNIRGEKILMAFVVNTRKHVFSHISVNFYNFLTSEVVDSYILYSDFSIRRKDIMNYVYHAYQEGRNMVEIGKSLIPPVSAGYLHKMLKDYCLRTKRVRPSKRNKTGFARKAPKTMNRNIIKIK